MQIIRTILASAMDVKGQFIKDLIIKGSATKSFQVSHNIHQRALRYNSNTIATYPKTLNITVYIGHHKHPYKSYYTMAAGLLLYYK